MQHPSSPSCTVAGGGGVGGGDDGIVIPPEYLRWLIDDDDGFLHRTTTAAEAEPSPGPRAAAAPSSHSPMQRQPTSSSCTAAGGGAGGDEEDPFDDIVIPPDLLQWLDDDDGWCLHGAGALMGVKAEDEQRLSSELQVGDHSPIMQQPPSCTVAGEGAEGDEDPFDDIVMPQGLLDDHGEDDAEVGAADERHRRLAVAEAQARGGDGCVEDELSMTYRGHTFIFDSVPPHKVETILMLLNGCDLAPQSAEPRPTNLVHPIVVPQHFDRVAAMSRYRKKRKITVKADYSVRREIASRIARSREKFVRSAKSSENAVGTKVTELQSCANCGESSMVVPQMRRGPSGTRNFCNACGLAWATYRKIRNVKNTRSRHGGS